ncbi:hypothetical protein KEM56_005331 [Ascosphaera pollenicola]|nr:hypothetical protein KEM56_005331 [Ascosphaera pollenicola]
MGRNKGRSHKVKTPTLATPSRGPQQIRVPSAQKSESFNPSLLPATMPEFSRNPLLDAIQNKSSLQFTIGLTAMVEKNPQARKLFSQDDQLPGLLDANGFEWDKDCLCCKTCKRTFAFQAHRKGEGDEFSNIFVLNTDMVDISIFYPTGPDNNHHRYAQPPVFSAVDDLTHAKCIIKDIFAITRDVQVEEEPHCAEIVDILCKGCCAVFGHTDNAFFFLGGSSDKRGYVVPCQKPQLLPSSYEADVYLIGADIRNSDLVDEGWVTGINVTRETDLRCEKCSKRFAVLTSKAGGIGGKATILAFNVQAISVRKYGQELASNEHAPQLRRVEITFDETSQKIRRFLDLPLAPEQVGEQKPREEEDDSQDETCDGEGVSQSGVDAIPDLASNPGRQGEAEYKPAEQEDTEPAGDDHQSHVDSQGTEETESRDNANDWKDAYKTLSLTLAELRAERERVAFLEKENQQLRATYGLATSGGDRTTDE